MPEILIFFLGGLMASAAVGLAFYYLIGPASDHAVRRVFGERTGPLWGRSFRIMMFVMALIGGLSTQWYGCDGYQDYKTVAADRGLMFEKTTTQVTGAISYAKWFVILAAGVGAVAVALLTPRRPAPGPKVAVTAKQTADPLVDDCSRPP